MCRELVVRTLLAPDDINPFDDRASRALAFMLGIRAKKGGK